MKEKNGLLNLAIFLVAIGILIALMIVGSTVLIPMAWALIFTFLVLPIANFLESKKLSRALASTISTLIIFVTILAIMFFLVYEASVILETQGNLYDRLSEVVLGYLRTIESEYHVPIMKQIESSGENSPGILALAAKEIVALGENIVTLILIPMYLFFFLNYRGLVHKFIDRHYEGEARSQVSMFMDDAETSVEGYLKGTLILVLIAAAMTFIILLLFGIQHAFFFAVFIAVFNLVPYIGNLLTLAITFIFALLTKDSLSTALFLLLALYLSHMVQESLLKPKLVGDRMEMNAFVIFTAVITGGLIWGFSGMILFIPLVGILKAFIDNNPAWKNHGIFFGT